MPGRSIGLSEMFAADGGGDSDRGRVVAGGAPLSHFAGLVVFSTSLKNAWWVSSCAAISSAEMALSFTIVSRLTTIREQEPSRSAARGGQRDQRGRSGGRSVGADCWACSARGCSGGQGAAVGARFRSLSSADTGGEILSSSPTQARANTPRAIRRVTER